MSRPRGPDRARRAPLPAGILLHHALGLASCALGLYGNRMALFGAAIQVYFEGTTPLLHVLGCLRAARLTHTRLFACAGARPRPCPAASAPVLACSAGPSAGVCGCPALSRAARLPGQLGPRCAAMLACRKRAPAALPSAPRRAAPAGQSACPWRDCC